MKTQKQLPKEFVFICDEHSIEQLEKLGISNKLDLTIKPLFNIIYVVINNNIIDFKDDYCHFNEPEYDNYPLISLSDYLPTEQKWQDKTRGGYEYVIYEEFEGVIYGRVKNRVGWDCIMWFKYGGAKNYVPEMDLLPLDPHAQRKAEVKSEIERLQKELEQLDK